MGDSKATPFRFISEFGLNMVANGSVLLQDEHLEHLDNLLPPDAPDFHIYIIGSRPRIAIDPAAFAFFENSLKGAFVVYIADQRISVPFECAHPPQGRVNRLESDWPHTTFRLMNNEQKVLQGKVALLAAGFPKMAEFLDLEVLYIGQSFGTQGEREAADRLQSHSTLQKILGEASRQQPDREVWLTMFHFEDIVLTSIDPRDATAEMLEADDQHLQKVFAKPISEQQKINFTEAALIRFFEPRYNEMFRKNFPDTAHKSYSECYDIELNMVSVELSTEDINLRLYSSAQPRNWIHFAIFPLHDAKERRFMLEPLVPQ